MEQADGLCVVRGALRLLNVFAGSRNERVLFFTFGEIGTTLTTLLCQYFVRCENCQILGFCQGFVRVSSSGFMSGMLGYAAVGGGRRGRQGGLGRRGRPGAPR